MTEGCFRVYRLAEAPQEYVEFARLGRDDDPIVVVEKDAPESMRIYALQCRQAMGAAIDVAAGRASRHWKRDETPTHIIYTVDRG